MVGGTRWGCSAHTSPLKAVLHPLELFFTKIHLIRPFHLSSQISPSSPLIISVALLWILPDLSLSCGWGQVGDPAWSFSTSPLHPGQDWFILSLFPFASFPVRMDLLPALHNHFFKMFMEIICGVPGPLSFSDVQLAVAEREKDWTWHTLLPSLPSPVPYPKINSTTLAYGRTECERRGGITVEKKMLKI